MGLTGRVLQKPKTETGRRNHPAMHMESRKQKTTTKTDMRYYALSYSAQSAHPHRQRPWSPPPLHDSAHRSPSYSAIALVLLLHLGRRSSPHLSNAHTQDSLGLAPSPLVRQLRPSPFSKRPSSLRPSHPPCTAGLRLHLQLPHLPLSSYYSASHPSGLSLCHSRPSGSTLPPFAVAREHFRA